MEKSNVYYNCLLTYASILSLLLGASCSSPKISQRNPPAIESSAAYISAENNGQPHQIGVTTAQMVDEIVTEEQFLASTSTNDNTVAAAATRTASASTVLPSSREVNEVIAHARTQASIRSNKAAGKKQNLTKSLSFPARVMLKSIAKKAQKLDKKQGEHKAQNVNNSRYLIAGIILAAAGLVLVIAGNTTLLYVLGAVAALAGLILLLLALL